MVDTSKKQGKVIVLAVKRQGCTLNGNAKGKVCLLMNNRFYEAVATPNIFDVVWSVYEPVQMIASYHFTKTHKLIISDLKEV